MKTFGTNNWILKFACCFFHSFQFAAWDCQLEEKPNDWCGERKKFLNAKISLDPLPRDAIPLWFFVYAEIVIQNYSFLELIFIYLLKSNKINFLFASKWVGTAQPGGNLYAFRNFLSFGNFDWSKFWDLRNLNN